MIAAAAVAAAPVVAVSAEEGASSSTRDRSDRRSSRSRSRSRDRSERRSRRHSSRSRSRSRDRDSRSRSNERRRRKKKSGWDLAPEPGMVAAGGVGVPGAFAGMQAPPAVVSGSVHPSRMAQLGNLPGAVPGGAPMANAYNPLAAMQSMHAPAGAIPPHLAALMNPSALSGLGVGAGAGLGASLGGGSLGAVNTTNLPGTRQARRLYVGSIPQPITEAEMKQFFDAAMRQAFPDLPPGDSIVSVYLNLQKSFAFCEFRNPEEATTGLGLDGVVMRGQTLRIKRPSDYNPAMHGSAPSASRITPAMGGGGGGGGGSAGGFSGQISSQVPDGPNKIFCGGIPYSLSEHEVMELLGSFGQLRAFHLVKDRETNSSKGYCFFEYVDPSLSDTAVAGLNNLRIGEKTLTVRRTIPKAEMMASGGMMMPPMGQMGGMGGMQGAMPGMGDMTAGLTPAQIAALAALRSQGAVNPYAAAAAPVAPVAPAAPSVPPTRILVMTQMVVPSELLDDTEYREIFEDIESECRRFGEVRTVLIPRPRAPGSGSSEHVPGLGKVFVEFGLTEHAVKARAEVEGRQFDGRTVATTFLDEERWARRELD